MAWRAPEHGATASGPSATALEARAVAGGAQDRGGAVGGTPGVPRRRPAGAGPAPAPFSELHQSRSAPGPDAVRIHSNSKKKRAPTTSDRHDARRYHDDGVEAEGADFDAGFWPERLLFAPARDDVITKTPSTRCQVQVQCPRRGGAWRSAISTNLRCSWPPLASSLSSSATRLRKISTLLSFSARIVLAREDRLV